MTARRWAAWVVALALVAPACRMPYVPGVTSPPPAAIARLLDSGGRTVGSATLLQDRAGVRVLLDVSGLPPGVKTLRIHAVGRCDPPSFTSAGARLDPTKGAGGLSSITVEASGRGHLETTTSQVTLDKGAASLLDADGSALVVYARPDDSSADPDGASGARIACGVIVRAE